MQPALQYMKEAAREFPGALHINSVGIQLSLTVQVDGQALHDARIVTYAAIDAAETNILVAQLREMHDSLKAATS